MVEDAILAARILRPYYGMALAALQPYAVDGLGTIAVDAGWRLYVDPEWFQTLDPNIRAGVIAGHEIEHLLRRHSDRFKASGSLAINMPAWNCCGDAEINDDCDLPLPPDSVMPKTFGAPDGLTLEEYLGYLPEQHASPDCGSGAGGDPRDYEADGEGVPADAVEQVVSATAAAVRSHVKDNGRGSVPSGIVMWADAEVTRRVMPPTWDRKLASIVGKHVRSIMAGRRDYSFSRLHRRTRAGAVVRPSTVSSPAKVAIVVDTSGSMSQEGSRVLSTVRQIAAKYNAIVIDCDAEVKQTRSAKKKAAHVGGGGTDLVPAMELAAKSADVVVVVTDCETPWPTKALKVPTIVVDVAGRGASIPDWAQVVRAA